jgi:D-alanyl-D-alanine carboxypeptidase/D-alanyl-D-alanine-endopeptidase (penicillin-binding protein 4)
MKTRLIAAAALMLLAVPQPQATAQTSTTVEQRVAAKLAEAGPGVRFGLVVAAEDGRELVAIAPDARFIPASNTKIFTTAAAFAILAPVDAPDADAGASVRLEPSGGAPDVVFAGRGDARLSSAPDCRVDCLATLADAVAARTRTVRHVVGDDSHFPDERWSAGMSWNNIPTRSGTAVSALSLDDNEVPVRVSPTLPGRAATAEPAPYYEVDIRVLTVAAGETAIAAHRIPGSRRLRLTGTILASDPPELVRLGIDDPAHYAAWRLEALLEARGVRVRGDVMVRRRPLVPFDDPETRGSAPPPRALEPPVLARLAPPPLVGDLTIINKASQNLHAELLLRRIGRVAGTGSVADGLAAVDAVLARAGVPRAAYDLSDGSGMSTYNRVSPRGMVTLLRWIAAQPWGPSWRATLPVAGVDGTLRRRFRGTALEGRLFAKTGTLNATHALAGYMLARSGRVLTFAVYANDIPADARVTPTIDAALLQIADTL